MPFNLTLANGKTITGIPDEYKNPESMQKIIARSIATGLDSYEPYADKLGMDVLGPELKKSARSIAEQEGLDPDIFERMVLQESAYKPKATSHKGAMGLSQLMPDTAKYIQDKYKIDLSDPYQPFNNLKGGAKYLREQVEEFGGDYELALAAYNAGPGAVKKYGNAIPPYEETQNYVRKILGEREQEQVDKLLEKEEKSLPPVAEPWESGSLQTREMPKIPYFDNVTGAYRLYKDFGALKDGVADFLRGTPDALLGAASSLTETLTSAVKATEEFTGMSLLELSPATAPLGQITPIREMTSNAVEELYQFADKYTDKLFEKPRPYWEDAAVKAGVNIGAMLPTLASAFSGAPLSLTLGLIGTTTGTRDYYDAMEITKGDAVKSARFAVLNAIPEVIGEWAPMKILTEAVPGLDFGMKNILKYLLVEFPSELGTELTQQLNELVTLEGVDFWAGLEEVKENLGTTAQDVAVQTLLVGGATSAMGRVAMIPKRREIRKQAEEIRKLYASIATRSPEFAKELANVTGDTTLLAFDEQVKGLQKRADELSREFIKEDTIEERKREIEKELEEVERKLGLLGKKAQKYYDKVIDKNIETLEQGGAIQLGKLKVKGIPGVFGHFYKDEYNTQYPLSTILSRTFDPSIRYNKLVFEDGTPAFKFNTLTNTLEKIEKAPDVYFITTDKSYNNRPQNKPTEEDQAVINTLKNLRKKFLPEETIYYLDWRNLTENVQKIANGWANYAGQDDVFTVAIKTNRPQVETQNTVAHEFGHVYFATKYKGLSSKTQWAIWGDFYRWLQASDRLTNEQLIDLHDGLLRPSSNFPGDWYNRFDEYLANQFTRYVANPKSIQGELGKLFGDWQKAMNVALNKDPLLRLAKGRKSRGELSKALALYFRKGELETELGRLVEGVAPEAVEDSLLAIQEIGNVGLDRAFAEDILGGVQSAVWHAGPNPWGPEPGFPKGRPRLDKVGTGEGGQMFGWGWYSAENEEVSGPKGAYVRTFAKYSAFTYKGKTYSEAELENLKTDPEVVAAYYIKDSGSVAKAKKELEENIADAKRRGVFGHNFKLSSQALRAIDSVDVNAIAKSNAFVARLEIPDSDIQRMLQWEKPLSEQTPEVQKALEKLPADTFGWDPINRYLYDKNNTSMEQVYHRLQNLLPEVPGEHPKKKVSEYLRSIGIVGNKYLDQGSRKPTEAPTYNYVVWDQEVLDRVGSKHLDWETGEPLYSPGPETPEPPIPFKNLSTPEQRKVMKKEMVRLKTLGRRLLTLNQLNWRYNYDGTTLLPPEAQAAPPLATFADIIAGKMNMEKGEFAMLGEGVHNVWNNKIFWAERKAFDNFLHAIDIESSLAGKRITFDYAPDIFRSGKKLLEAAGIKNPEQQERVWKVYEEIQKSLDFAIDKLYDMFIANVPKKFPQLDAVTPDQLLEIEEKIAQEKNRLEEERKRFKDGNYFPFKRFGDYFTQVIAAEDLRYGGMDFKKGQQVIFEQHIQHKQAKKSQGDVLNDPQLRGKINVRIGKLPDNTGSFLMIPQQMWDMIEQELLEFSPEVAQSLGYAAGKEVEEGVKKGLETEKAAMKIRFREIRNRLSAERSFRKHLARKDHVFGWEEDGLRSFAAYFQTLGNYYIRLNNVDALKQQISEMDKMARVDFQGAGQGIDVTAVTEIANYMRSQLNFVMNPGKQYTGLTSFGFYWYLGAVPASVVTQLSQPLMTGGMIASEYGPALATAHYIKNYKDIISGKLFKASKNMQLEKINKNMSTQQVVDMLSKELNLDADVVEAIQLGIERQLIDQSFFRELATAAAQNNYSGLSPTMRGKIVSPKELMGRFGYIASWGFAQGEKANRLVVFKSVYELERNKLLKAEGKKRLDQLDAEEQEVIKAKARDKAEAMVQLTQGEYRMNMRPEFFRGWKAPLLLFQMFPQTMAYLQGRPL